MSSFYIETYGCQMNTAESDALEALLLGAGMKKAERPQDCDVAIINTCSVRQSAENRIWGRLGSYTPIKRQKKMTLILTGCMAQRLGEDIKKSAPQLDYVVSVNDKMKILEIARAVQKDEKPEYEHSENYDFASSYYREGEFSSFVPIMNGCNNFCSYCIVPYVRGREVSRDVESILNEVRYLDSKNVKEITLLGQNVNSYNYNGIRFPELLKKVASLCSNIQWIRFESPHPKDFSDELIEVIKTEKKVAKHIHVPMQSGSTKILKDMNRRYTAEQYLSLIDRIRKEIPEITFAVDVMVGLPGETEEDFNDTIKALDTVGYIEAYMYYWNPREGTRAVTMDGQLSEKEKQERLQKLIDFQLKKAAGIKEKRAGGIQDVLALSVSRDNSSQMLGRNEHNEMVVFDLIKPVEPGSMTQVEFLYLNGNTYVGRQV